jgi:cathepsin B
MSPLFFALALVCASAAPIVDPELIKLINSPNSGAHWTAGVNEKFIGVPLSEARRFLGVLPMPDSEIPANMKVVDTGRPGIPEEYDVRAQHPGCVIPVRDQKQCGSCWAFGLSESLSDRFNIRDNTCTPDTLITLSPQDLVSCDKQQQGCGGGWPIKAWTYTNVTGLTLDSCDPYTSGGGSTGVCKVGKKGDACPGKGVQEFYHSGEGYKVLGEEAMKTEIYDNGPIEVVFEVYNDFFNYKSGVYHHVSGGLAGYHAVKMIGWGIDKKDNTPYWILYNSWGTSWGMKGEFWVKRGTNECHMETPQQGRDTLCNSAGLPGEIEFKYL